MVREIRRRQHTGSRRRKCRKAALYLGVLVFAWPTLLRATEPQIAEPQGAGVIKVAGMLSHESLLAEKGPYPSAATCKRCHPDQYRQWSMSPHAYAQMSPIFNAMQGTVIKLTNGTNGDFCIRCHSPAGMAQSEPLFTANFNRSQTAREGITCVVCHRTNKAYGKISGRMAIVPGSVVDPVYGPTGNKGLLKVLANPQDYEVVTKTLGARPDCPECGPNTTPIHADAVDFFQLDTSGFCGTCHDVLFINGFRLEEAFSSYKNSPAARRGVSCQDCHMGKTPGKAEGYSAGPVVRLVGEHGIEIIRDKVTNHTFAGPDHSIIHPGLYPHQPFDEVQSQVPAIRHPQDWLAFRYREGWGTAEFERHVKATDEFPDPWTTREARFQGRDFLERQLDLLREYFAQRKQILQAGYQIGEITTQKVSTRGIQFKVEIKNATDGHQVPTGFIAERVLFLRVIVRDATGTQIFKSGDLDPNGDLRDLHSHYVHDGKLPLDPFLFNLQSKFITRNNRGGEQEQVLALNFSGDPLLFARPAPLATTLTGQPRGSRIHRQTIPPLRSRWAQYKVKRSALTGKGPYTAKIQLIAGMVPINLVDAISLVGFDYGMSARDVARGVLLGQALGPEGYLKDILSGHVVLEECELAIDVESGEVRSTCTEGSTQDAVAK